MSTDDSHARSRMTKAVRKPSTRARAIPKTIAPATTPKVSAGSSVTSPAHVRVLWYDQDHCEEKESGDVAICAAYSGRAGTTWIDVTGVGDSAVLQDLGRIYHLHPLALEDVQNLRERPKVETYEGQKFVVFRLVRLGDAVTMEQISAFLVGSTLITLQEDPVDPWESVRMSIREGVGRVRSEGADYLLYSLVDVAIDAVFPIIEQLGDQLEDLETAVIDQPTPETLESIFTLKKELLMLRKTVWPEREVVLGLQQDLSGLIKDETKLYLRDAYDHSIQLMDMLETYRDLASNMVEAYLSSLSNRMNDIMKTLTIISTIFVPLTFIVGLYGMNFRNFPEIEWKYGYPFVWALMAVVVVFILRYYRRKHWL